VNFVVIVVSLVALLIVWHAWKWPRRAEVTPSRQSQETTRREQRGQRWIVVLRDRVWSATHLVGSSNETGGKPTQQESTATPPDSNKHELPPAPWVSWDSGQTPSGAASSGRSASPAQQLLRG
jgi:hypothetical protein